MNADRIKVLENMSAAHLENVKQKIAELRNQQQVLEVEIQKLVQYVDANLKVLNSELSSQALVE